MIVVKFTISPNSGVTQTGKPSNSLAAREGDHANFLVDGSLCES